MESLSLKPSGSKVSVHFEPELAGCSALIVDSDNTSRWVLARQLRDFGFNDVVQFSKVQPARDLLQTRRFDVVLCAQYFGPDSPTGQDLLDDLRRDALLPFATVFIMVTAEASYSKVEQAAESALDGYLLKPHSAVSLAQRLLAARRRKAELADIFRELEDQNVERAIGLCLRQYESRTSFGPYCARLAAELMLRSGRFEQARALYETIAAESGEPWARAGVARALLSNGAFAQAIALLQQLTTDIPEFADAYDLLGRAQLKLGQLEEAMSSYRHASGLTPSSISRLQRLGMLAYYLGDAGEAEQLLDQATLLGQSSASYDYQSLALLALLRAAQGNWQGVQRCRDVGHSMLRRTPDTLRLRRIVMVIEGLALLQRQSLSEAATIVRDLGDAAMTAEFDFDLASDLLGLLALLEEEGARVEDAPNLVKRLAHRFCTNDATCRLLEAASRLHEPFVQLVRQCSHEVLALSEEAMKLHLQGDSSGAIDAFIELTRIHLNARFWEAAHQLAQRQANAESASGVAAVLQSLRERAGLDRARPGLGGTQGRPAAGVVLRVSAPLPQAHASW